MHAVVALVAASRRPDLVRSLVPIEPPLLDLAAGDPAVDQIRRAMAPVQSRAAGITAADYVHASAAAVMGYGDDQVDAWTSTWGPAAWAAADASRRERWPGDAPVDLSVLAGLPCRNS